MNDPNTPYTGIKVESHFGGRSGWIRASVLGANDGILSTASLVIGVAAASAAREPIVLAGLAGLVAGAFILASLERVFRVTVLQPVYRLSLLTALSFMIVAPLPLLAHLGHPERALQMFLTPHTQSAMAMFGFVYAWYLSVVLLLEIWFDYRKNIVIWSHEKKGIMK